MYGFPTRIEYVCPIKIYTAATRKKRRAGLFTAERLFHFFENRFMMLLIGRYGIAAQPAKLTKQFLLLVRQAWLASRS